MENESKLVKQFSCGNVRASIFSKQMKSDKGTEYEVLNTKITKNYKDKDDNWQTTDNYQKGDLAKLRYVVEASESFVQNLKIVDPK